jgi:hypothetical protein
MYSFVGLITVPSNQKTGHKKLNRYESVFSKTVNKDNQILTTWQTSTVMKYLQKHIVTIFQESCMKPLLTFIISTCECSISLVDLVI